VIGKGVLVERLYDLSELLVQALEELEAGRCEATRTVLVEMGDKLISARAQAVTERRLFDRTVRWTVKLLDAGERQQP
jgi:hypothetical protein